MTPLDRHADRRAWLARLPGYVERSSAAGAVRSARSSTTGSGRSAPRSSKPASPQFLGSGVEFLGSLTAQVAPERADRAQHHRGAVPHAGGRLLPAARLGGHGRRRSTICCRASIGAKSGTVLDEIDRSMAGVIRGQGGIVLVLCVYYAAALTLTGLNFGLVIGLITGLLELRAVPRLHHRLRPVDGHRRGAVRAELVVRRRSCSSSS